MTATATSATANIVRSLQVSGSTTYDGNQWREAILAYLHGVWSGDPSVCHRQKLSINYTTIRLSGERPEYYAYFVCEQDIAERPRLKPHELFAVPYPAQNDVEIGLARFVHDNQIRQLILNFPGSGHIALTKGRKRGELFISTNGLANIEVIRRRFDYDNEQ